MAHRTARLNVRGRALLVERVLGQRRPVAHVAKELGVSRQCAHRWINRFRHERPSGLQDRSARPHRSPKRTSAEVEAPACSACVEISGAGRTGSVLSQASQHGPSARS